MSALTIREMADIARKHGLVPIPLDLNLQTLSPEVSSFASRITPRTRALVIAHLFGSLVPMDPFIETAKANGIFVFEDCAQAFIGSDYEGHPETDAVMFSFGPIKTATALGGGLLSLRNPELHERVAAVQQAYPVQTKGEFAQEALTHVGVKLITQPLLFGIFYRTCVSLGKDFDAAIRAARNLPEGEEDVSVIRRRPSSPQVALLARRLRSFDRRQMEERSRVGAEFARSLPPGIEALGKDAKYHSYWVFPALVQAPERFADQLRAHGFDATTAGSALSVIEPPHASAPAPGNLRAAFPRLIYLPVYPELPQRARARLRAALHKLDETAAHLTVTDARRVYSARLRTIETPSRAGDIRDSLARAAKDDLPVGLMGARHNLGSHAFVNGGLGLDMTHFARIVSLDPARKRITVEAGTTWERIQEAIQPHGLALQAMQSDNNFTVGGSLASNAHGRDLHASTIIQSVLGFRMMLADGEIVSASRDQNTELFRLAIGGYGLFGVFLEVDLALEDDCCFQQNSVVISLRELPDYFRRTIQPAEAARFFVARPSIAPNRLLDDTIVTVWSRSDRLKEGVLPLDRERSVRRDRFLFGLSRKYEWGKKLRWHVERFLSMHPANGGIVSRNNAMRPPICAVKMFDYDSPHDTDVIQEFFLPIASFAPFADAMRALLRRSQTNLLGITVRYVKRDAESVLSYAPQEDALAAVIYFNEPLTSEGRAKSESVIQQLTRLAIDHGGTFYLTYIRDVAPGDLRRAYPAIASFFQAKRRFDPEARFRNRFFQQYGAQL